MQGRAERREAGDAADVRPSDTLEVDRRSLIADIEICGYIGRSLSHSSHSADYNESDVSFAECGQEAMGVQRTLIFSWHGSELEQERARLGGVRCVRLVCSAAVLLTETAQRHPVLPTPMLIPL